jgi:hypothetical protein
VSTLLEQRRRISQEREEMARRIRHLPGSSTLTTRSPSKEVREGEDFEDDSIGGGEQAEDTNFDNERQYVGGTTTRDLTPAKQNRQTAALGISVRVLPGSPPPRCVLLRDGEDGIVTLSDPGTGNSSQGYLYVRRYGPFGRVFDSHASQSEVFEGVGEEAVRRLVEGDGSTTIIGVGKGLGEEVGREVNTLYGPREGANQEVRK